MIATQRMRRAPTNSPYERMAELSSAGRPFALATVVRTHGSTPQTIGSKLIVTLDEAERPFGTLGGGCVESDAILAAREVLETGGRILREYRLTEDLAWNSGLVCGGTMWILAERGDIALRAGDVDLTAEALNAARGGRPLALVTQLRKEGRSYAFERRVAVRADGELVGTLGSDSDDEVAERSALDQIGKGPARLVVADADRELFIDPIISRPQLVIAGGGHVGKALARQASLLDFDVTVLEDRPEFARADRFDGAAVIDGDMTSGIASFNYGPQSFLVVATRGHKLDADCVRAAVDTNVPYIGLLGSRRKTVLIENMLREEGKPAERIATIHAPVGLDLGGRTPAEIALSVLAEITQLRYSGSGKPLSKR